MKNIAIIFNKLSGGGAERIAGLLSMYLCQCNKYNVYLFLEDPKDILYEYGGKIIDIGKRGFDYLEYTIREAKREYRIDVAISFMELFNFINIRTRLDERVIISERDYIPIQPTISSFDDMMKKRLYGKADQIVAISKGIEYNLLNIDEVSRDRIRTIYNFCLVDRIKDMSQENPNILDDDLFEQYHVIVSFGRLAREKNHKRLIYQFYKVVSMDPLARLLIIGSGECKDEIDDLIETMSISSYVITIPYCPNPFFYVAKSKVFVFSSKAEGYGNVILEAMAVKTPVVAVDCVAGPREILADDYKYDCAIETWKNCKRGILVTRSKSEDTGATSHLADALVYAIGNDDNVKKMVAEAYNWISTRSNEDITHEWMNVIDDVENHRKETHLQSISRTECFIYGAGEFAKKLLKQLLKNGIRISGLIVTKKESGQTEMCGKPVFELCQVAARIKNMDVYIGVINRTFLDEITIALSDLGANILDNPVIEPDNV